MPSSKAWAQRAAVLLMLLSGACQAPPPPAAGGDPTGHDAGPMSMSDGGTACLQPEQGCACDAIAPRDCYLDPTTTGSGDMLCHRGTRYCRGGLWSGCESIHDYTVTTSSALITGPSICNPCDPRCFVTRDTPTTADLTPSDSSSAVYDPMRGGVVITSSMVGGGVGQIDLNMNGIPDVSENCMGLGFATLPNGTCDPSVWILHALALGHSVSDRQSFTFTFRSADVYILMDTTGSMGGELTNLRTGLTTGTYPAGATCGVGQGILGAIQCQIPSAYFGVGYHDDYPYCVSGSRCYGWNGFNDNPSYGAPDFAFVHVQDMTASVASAQAAVNTLVIHNGQDGPESQIPALDTVATGAGLGPYRAARAGCAASTWGFPCFRTGTIPIIIHITDAPYHNGPGGSYPYCFGGTPGTGAATSVGSCPRTGTGACGRTNFCTSAGNPAIELGDATARYISYTGDTSGTATDNFSNWSCGASVSSAGTGDMVFHFSLATGQQTTISTQGSSYDTMIAVFARTASACPDRAATGSCNDDAGGTAQSTISTFLPAGEYYVVVDGWSNSEGAFTLTIGVPPPTCSGATYTAPTFAQTASDLNARGVRVITMQTCGNWSDPYCLQGESDAIALGRATRSTTPSTTGLCATPTSTNCRSTDAYVYRGNADGTGLSTNIVSAVVDLANYARSDISAVPLNDTWGFVQSIVPRGATPGTCTGQSSPCFDIGGSPIACWLGCTPGSSVDFTINLTNTHAPPGLYFFEVDIISLPGGAVLARVPVRIIVPGTATVYAPSASYWHDYDSTLTCTIDERPAWGTLNYTLDIPAGTRVQFTLAASDTLAGLPTATPVATFTVNPPATGTTVTGSQNVDALLMAAGVQANLRYLRTTVTLFADATLLRSPALQAMSLDYTCIPAE